jgi:hypothetical protein
MMRPTFRLVWRSAPDQPLKHADVPHLEPIRRVLATGRDGVVRLPDGRRLRPSQVVSLAETDDAGRVRAAWEVRRHGLDGTFNRLTAWRAVAAGTAGVQPEDPRWRGVWTALAELEAADAAHDAWRWAVACARLELALDGCQERGRMEVA